MLFPFKKFHLSVFLLFTFLSFFSQDEITFTSHYPKGYYWSKRKCEKELNNYNYVGFKKGEVIADIGTYSGTIPLAIALFNEGLTIYLQEGQPDRLNRCGFYEMKDHFTKNNGKLLSNNFKFVLGDHYKSNLPDSTFDKILMSNTFEYISKVDLYLKDLKCKLKRNGKVLITTDNPFTDQYFIKIFEANGFTCEKNNSKNGRINLTFNAHEKQEYPIRDIFDAVIQKNYEKTKEFLDNGTDPNIKLYKANLILFAASTSNNEKIIELIISKGGDPNGNKYDLFSFSPLGKIGASGDHETAKCLINNGADVNLDQPLVWATWFGHNFDLIKLLIEKGAKIYGGDSTNLSVINTLAYSRDINIIKYILNLPGIKDIHAKNKFGKSFLHRVVISNKPEAVEYLLNEKGFFITDKDNVGMTPLMYAVYGGNPEMVKYLVEEKKVNVNEKNNLGFSALKYALYPEISNYLISKGAL